MFNNMDLSFFLSTASIYIYCGVIVFITLYSYLNFRRLIRPITKEMKLAIERISQTERTKEAFPADYYDFKEWMDNSKYLQDSWREFEETLLIPGEDFDDDKQIILNTQLTSIHFNQKNILWHKVNMRFYNSLPNMLTGLGIIGTFIGLAVGIYIAAPGLNSESMDDAKGALNLLLSGASLAFITSIAGLLSSLVFSYLEKRKLHKFNRFCQKLVSEIDARVEYFSAERLASKNLNESQKQSVALESFANDLAVSLGQVIEQQVARPLVAAINELKEEQKSANDETLEKLLSEFSSSITGAAGEEMKEFASTMGSVSSNLESQMNAMTLNQTQMQEASQQAVLNMADAMAEGSEKIKDEINGAVSSLAEGIGRSLDAVSNQLNSAAEVLSEKLSESINGFDGVLLRIKDVTDKHEEIAGNTAKLHSELNNSIEKAGETVLLAGNINDAFNNSIEQLTDFTQSVANSSKSVKESSSQMVDLADKMTQSQETIKSHWDSYNDRFEAVDISLSTALTSLKEGLNGYASSTNEYVLGLDKHAAQVVQDLSSAVQEVNDAMELISETLESQKTSFLSSVNEISDKSLSDMKRINSESSETLESHKNSYSRSVNDISDKALSDMKRFTSESNETLESQKTSFLNSVNEISDKALSDMKRINNESA
jgi:methyl-accepting chemotaxis protein